MFETRKSGMKRRVAAVTTRTAPTPTKSAFGPLPGSALTIALAAHDPASLVIPRSLVRVIRYGSSIGTASATPVKCRQFKSRSDGTIMSADPHPATTISPSERLLPLRLADRERSQTKWLARMFPRATMPRHKEQIGHVGLIPSTAHGRPAGEPSIGPRRLALIGMRRSLRTYCHHFGTLHRRGLVFNHASALCQIVRPLRQWCFLPNILRTCKARKSGIRRRVMAVTAWATATPTKPSLEPLPGSTLTSLTEPTVLLSSQTLRSPFSSLPIS